MALTMIFVLARFWISRARRTEDTAPMLAQTLSYPVSCRKHYALFSKLTILLRLICAGHTWVLLALARSPLPSQRALRCVALASVRAVWGMAG